MKLRNKKTGEIKDLLYVINNLDNGKNTFSLAELNAEWEDYYEEPKRYWFINSSGGVDSIALEDDTAEGIDGSKQIGNYFETKEEAERAVEKLKAFKRLKDKGFRVIDYGDEDIRYEIKDRYNGCLYDLETVLFGGEE